MSAFISQRLVDSSNSLNAGRHEKQLGKRVFRKVFLDDEGHYAIFDTWGQELRFGTAEKKKKHHGQSRHHQGPMNL